MRLPGIEPATFAGARPEFWWDVDFTATLKVIINGDKGIKQLIYTALESNTVLIVYLSLTYYHSNVSNLMSSNSQTATSVELERSFSCLKLIKTRLRAAVTDDRLSDLAVLSMHSRRAEVIDLDFAAASSSNDIRIVGSS
jgi:hypothetical protein